MESQIEAIEGHFLAKTTNMLDFNLENSRIRFIL